MNNVSKKLSWNEFFVLRKKNEVKRKLFGIPGIIGFFGIEGAVLSMPIYDATFTVFGLDPLVFIGMSTILGAASGYYASSTLGSFVWRKLNPNLSLELDQKQKDFYHRITKYRANVPPNPTQLNFSFDFYGEKIKSVHDYRDWLRKQGQLKRNRVFSL